MLFLLWKLLKPRKGRPPSDPGPETPRTTPSRKPKPEWNPVLLGSLETNNLAPSEETILHAYDLFLAELYWLVDERSLIITDLGADIVALVARLKALAPDLVERAMARHPFEFSELPKEDL